MPNIGGQAWPLARNDFEVDGSNCSPDGLPIGDDGKFTSETVDKLSDYVDDGLLRQEALDDYMNGLVDEDGIGHYLE